MVRPRNRPAPLPPATTTTSRTKLEVAQRKLLRRNVKIDVLGTKVQQLQQQLQQQQHAPPPPPPLAVPWRDDDGCVDARVKDVIVALVIEHHVPEFRAVDVIAEVLAGFGIKTTGLQPENKKTAERAIVECAEAQLLRNAIWLGRQGGWSAPVASTEPAVTPRSGSNPQRHPAALRGSEPTHSPVLALASSLAHLPDADIAAAIELAFPGTQDVARTLFVDEPSDSSDDELAGGGSGTDADAMDEHNAAAVAAATGASDAGAVFGAPEGADDVRLPMIIGDGSGDEDPAQPTHPASIDEIEDCFDAALCADEADVRQAGCAYIGLSTDGSSSYTGVSSLSLHFLGDEVRFGGLLDLPKSKNARAILEAVNGHLRDVRAAQALAGVPSRLHTCLYDVAAWAVDNENANLGEECGLLALAECQRKLEYDTFRATGERGEMGAYVPLIAVPCNLHISNLVDVALSKSLRGLDAEDGISVPAGHSENESFTYGFVRRLINKLRVSPAYAAFRREECGEGGEIPRMCTSRFWSVLRGATYLATRTGQLAKFAERTGLVHTHGLGELLSILDEHRYAVEFDMTLMSVARAAVHSPFAHSAANNDPEDHVAVARALYSAHEECAGNANASAAWWMAQVAALKASTGSELPVDALELPSDWELMRIKALHTAVTDVLDRHFANFLHSDETLAQVARTPSARFDTFGNERDFRDVFGMQARNVATNNGKMAAHLLLRDVGRESRFRWYLCGTVRDEDLRAPWPAYLYANLRARARSRVRRGWLRATSRRCQKLDDLVAKHKAEVDKREKVLAREQAVSNRFAAMGGGFVDVSGDRRLLEPGVRVSSSLLSAADAKDPRNGWTCDRLAAQLYLLGLPYTGKRDELIARLFTALDEDAKEADADV